MSRDYNKVILMGRLARDPDVRYTPSKQKVARFTLCTGKEWKDKTTGEKKSHTEFIPVTAWLFTADILEKYTKKGSRVMVEGRISTRDYDDVKTGQHKWVTEVVAESIILLGGKRDDDGVATPEHNGGYGDNGHMGSYGAADRSSTSSQRENEFSDDFPLDFSDLATPNGGGDVEIPF